MRAEQLSRLRGRVQAMHGMRRTAAACLFANAPVVVEVDIVHVAAGVIKMEADRVKANLNRIDSSVDQSLAQLTVFSAVPHSFVEASRPDDVAGPTGSVVSIPCRTRGCQRV